MKRKLSISITALFCTIILSCSGKKETPASVAQKWCDLNAKAFKAADGAAKENAEKDRKDFEKKMEAKYKDDKAFMDQVEKEVEKCEDASEGR